MSLYLKYRPTTFNEVIGNAETIESIQSMLEKEDHPHTFLLTGPTGCGKTTVARIIASELGCSEYDFKELNSADFRGIDSARDLIKQSQYKPLKGPIRVWLIDESHKLTGDAQNALLKILEDTPAHVYFILATTEPNKLIKTIKGRCSKFEMNLLQHKDMYKLLRKVSAKEGEKLEDDIYNQIIVSSDGHPRNALQILEQILNTEPENRLALAKKKEAEQNEGIELCRALMKDTSWKEIAKILKGIKEAGTEPETIRRIALGYAQSVLLNGMENDLAALIMQELREPLYDIGFPGLTFACYSIIKG